ncbi:MAG: cytidylate kinase family protein [Acidobacteriota bacterium]|jgi:cytidylate kinase
MAIITISRGSATGGLLLSEGLSKTLGYRIVRREEILQGTAKFGVAAAKLEKILFGPPTFSDDFKHDIRAYLSFFQAALCEYAQKDNVIYLGNLGHLLLRSIDHVLRIRLIAPLEYRIQMLTERGQMTYKEAAAYIDKIDAQRRAWTLLLYGVDWLNPGVYDLTINLENMNIDTAVEIAVAAARCEKYSATDLSRKAMQDLSLAVRVRAELAADHLIAPSEIEVEADSVTGTVFLEGKLPSNLTDRIVEIAGNIPGVGEVDKTRLIVYEPER